jgi:hypothetical protein
MGRAVECDMPKKGYVKTSAHRAKLAASQIGNSHATSHGGCPRGKRSPEYNAWVNMRARCSNPNHPKYPNYGGRGISVYPEWQDFPTFLKDVGQRPSSRHSIDRIDNDGDYRPGNVRWATAAKQRQNQSGTATNDQVALIRASNLTHVELSRVTGLSVDTISRIVRRVAYA